MTTQVAREAAPHVPLAVVVPVLNEAATVVAVLEDVRRHVLSAVDGAIAIVIDDGSTDATPELLQRIVDADPHISVLRGARPTGQGPAVRRGLEHVRADWYLQIDADGQIDVAAFAQLWALREHADLVLGVRQKRRDPLHRLAITTGTRLIVRLAARRNLRDAATPLRLISGALWDDLRSIVGPDELSFSVLVSVGAVLRGWNVAELHVNHRPRVAGRSHLHGVALVRFIVRSQRELRTLVARVRDERRAAGR